MTETFVETYEVEQVNEIPDFQGKSFTYFTTTLYHSTVTVQKVAIDALFGVEPISL